MERSGTSSCGRSCSTTQSKCTTPGCRRRRHGRSGSVRCTWRTCVAALRIVAACSGAPIAPADLAAVPRWHAPSQALARARCRPGERAEPRRQVRFLPLFCCAYETRAHPPPQVQAPERPRRTRQHHGGATDQQRRRGAGAQLQVRKRPGPRPAQGRLQGAGRVRRKRGGPWGDERRLHDAAQGRRVAARFCAGDAVPVQNGRRRDGRSGGVAAPGCSGHDRALEDGLQQRQRG